jgi:hypothetical protein
MAVARLLSRRNAASLASDMSTLQTRNDAFEHGDLAALLCVDDPHLQSSVIDELSQLGFAFHTALYPEEVAVRLRSRSYELVVVSERFGGSELDSNPVLHELTLVPLAQRRDSVVVLVGPGMESRSDMQAFIHGVDLTLREDELSNFKAIVGRAIIRQEEFYSAFKGVMQAQRGGV